MFIHGAWVTPACWDNFKSLYESRGIRCVAPAWPHLDKPISELKKGIDPRFALLTIKTLVDHYAALIETLPYPPVLIGHSFGGLIVQLLLDRGLGRCGVAIDSAPPRGVFPSIRAVRSALPIISSWEGWRRLHIMSFKAFEDTFANSLPPLKMRVAYDNHIVQAPGRIYFQAALGIGNGVNFSNPKRKPLLLVAAENDKTTTPSMVVAMFKRYSRSPVQVEMFQFEGRSHWLIADQDWEEVAEKVLSWIDIQSSLS